MEESINSDYEVCKKKTRIAEAAAVTLCRLNGIMKQMKDWRDDRVKLRSNICRLKLALRVVGRETDDILHADPLIEHQRAEIKRLETANQTLRKEITDVKMILIRGANDKHLVIKQEFFVEKERLNNEILYLKSRLKEVEKEHEHSSEMERLQCKLKHFMMVDHTMEIIFTDIVNKVAETIANLSEELVNVSKRLQMSRLKNDNLYLTIDKLKAMLRSKNGNTVDYQKRIVELDNLTNCMKSELCTFKINLQDLSWSKTWDYKNLRNAEQLATDLKNKLRNDYEAIIATDDPDCLNYIKRIIELRLNLKQLQVGLSETTVSLSSRCSEKTIEYNKYVKQISNLKSIFKEIAIEIDKLKNNYITKHCKFGGAENLEYLNKIGELQTIVEKARLTMNGLNRRTGDNSNEREEIKKLDGYFGKVCHEIKQLEAIVASNDYLSSYTRIEQLEESIVQLKVKSNEKDECAEILRQKLFDVETSFKQRITELTDAQRKVNMLTDENKTLKEGTKKMEEKISELRCENDGSKKKLEQLQQVKNEVNLTRRKLENIQADKDRLLKETRRMRDALQKRNNEYKFVISEKDAMEKMLNAKILDIGKNLQVATKEKTRLLNKLIDFEQTERKFAESISLKNENENIKQLRESSESKDVRPRQMKVELETLRESLNNANREIIYLNTRLDHFSDDKTKLEVGISHLESKKDMLVYQLGIEKTTTEEKLKEITKLMSDYDEMKDENADLKNERQQLRIEVTDLKTERELLKKSLENVNVKYSKLEDEVVTYKFECDVLREENGNLKANTDDLAIKLKEAHAELDGAGDKIRSLESENSSHRWSLDALAIKTTDIEGRVQVLLTEKNDLTTRINELNGENVVLKDQLNKVKTENEYSTIELNKLRTEWDKARTENTSLRNTVNETKRINAMLQKTAEGLKMELSGIHSEYRVLENQLKIFETTNAALKKEKETLYHEYVNSLRFGIPKAEKEGAAIVREMIFDKHDEQFIECVTKKHENERVWDNAKSDKRDKSEIKNTNDEMKKLIVENETLKFELLNLRNENFEVKMKLIRTTEEFQKQSIEGTQIEKSETAIMPIMNLCYKEINSYTDRYSDDTVDVLAHINRLSVSYSGSTTEQQSGAEIEGLLEIMNKLKVENVALKMELKTMRCSFVIKCAEDERRRNEFQNALEEIQALKEELTKLRDEKKSLRVRLDTAETKLNQLESERAALKDELYTLRKTNSDLKRKTTELRCDYQKLKERSVDFESCIMGAMKTIKKYTISTGHPNSLDDELKNLLQKLISNEEFLQSTNKLETNLEVIYVDPAPI